MSLAEHVYELRTRLFRALLGLTVGVVVAWFLFHPIFTVLREPYCQLPAKNRVLTGADCPLVFTDVFGAFFIRLKVSIMAGAVLSAPVWLYQLWAFITPGLHRNERRWSLAFVSSSIGFFALGGFFAYITLHKGLSLFLGFGGDGLASLLDANRYLGYVIAMLLVFGVSFEFPLLVIMLNLAGVVSARRLRASWRLVVFGIFVFAAVATPSQDPFTMMALALPLCVFYAAALVVTAMVDRRRARREAADGLAGLPDDVPSPLDLPAAVPVVATVGAGAGAGVGAGMAEGPGGSPRRVLRPDSDIT